MAQIRLPARRVLKSDAVVSVERRNDVRWAYLGHQRPDFQALWTSLRSARGTGTRSPIAPSQNPWKLRSYGSLFTLLGTRAKAHLAPFDQTSRINNSPIHRGNNLWSVGTLITDGAIVKFCEKFGGSFLVEFGLGVINQCISFSACSNYYYVMTRIYFLMLTWGQELLSEKLRMYLVIRK